MRMMATKRIIMNIRILAAALLFLDFARANCSSAEVTVSTDLSTLSCDPSTAPYKLNVTESGKLKSVTLKGDAVIENKGSIIDTDSVVQGSNSVNSYGIRVHNAQANISLTNSGTISGQQYGTNFDSVTQKITLQNFTNSGTISGDNNEGVFWGGEVEVENFTNSGTVKGSQGFWITEKSSKRPTVKNFTNSGTIEGKTRGIVLNKATIQTLTNSGKIQGETHAAIEVRQDSTLNKLIIDGSGAELSQKNGTSNSYNATDNSSSKGGIHNRGTIEAIELKNTAKVVDLINAKTNGQTPNKEGVIKNLSLESGALVNLVDNAGQIDAIRVSGADSKIQKLENSGSIQSITSENGGEITELFNKQGGKITGSIHLNEKTKSIKNEGEITGSLNFNESVTKLENSGSIANFIAHKEISDLTNHKSLTLQGSGLITSSLKQEAGATLSGVDIHFTGENIAFENKGSIQNRLYNRQNSKLSTFSNEGSVEYLHNDGRIHSFKNNQNASLKTLINAGHISGGLQNSGNIEHLENLGNIEPNATNEHIKNDAGKISVKKYYIRSNRRIPLAEHKNFVHPADVDSRLVITGNGASDVDFSAAQIYIDAHQYDFGVEYDIKHSILLKNSPHKPSAASPLSISNFADAKRYIIVYNKASNTFVINPNSKALFGAVFADFLVNYVQRRTIFLDTLLSDENTKLLSRENPEDKHWFFLPFYGHDDFSLSAREADSKANTQGFVTSFSHFDSASFYEWFLGLSRANSKTQINDAGSFIRLDGKHKGAFTGLKVKSFLANSDPYGLALQGTIKLAKRSADLTLLQQRAHTVRDKVSIYGMGAAANLEFYANGLENSLRLKNGVGYEGFRIGAFDLNLKNEAQNINLLHNFLSLSWVKNWQNNLSTTLELGNKFLLNNKIKTHFENDSDSFRLPRNYAFTQTSLQYALRKNLSLSLSYNGSFAHNGSSHNGFASVNFKY